MKIINKRKIKRKEKVYNLNVEDNHNYLAENCLVSNCHTASAKILSAIIQNCENAKYKIGLSGTLQKSKINILQLKGLFGSIHKVTTSSDLINKGILTKIRINSIILKYPQDVCKKASKLKYVEECDFIKALNIRIDYITKLALSRKGNTLLMFKTVDYGKKLYEICKNNKQNVYYIDGSISGEEREKIRNEVSKLNDSILVGSLGTMSTGVNIKNLHHIIFSESTKSFIKVVQSIGRVLRKHESKEVAILYDISDDLRISKKSKKNFLLSHFIERASYYESEKFPYKIKEYKFKNNIF